MTQACSSDVSRGSANAAAGQGAVAGSAEASAGGGRAGSGSGSAHAGGASGNLGVSGGAGNRSSGNASAGDSDENGSSGNTGASGRAGLGGSAGSSDASGAEAGMAGAAGEHTAPGCPSPEEKAPPLGEAICGNDVCGNGAIDSCVYGSSLDVSESCDLTAGIGENCFDLGYASGSTTCLSNCSFDRSACEDCVNTPSLLACAHPLVGKSLPTSIGLASKGNELGLGWITTPNYVYGSEPGALRFARFRADLTLISETKCLPVSGLRYVEAVAAAKDGWWLLAAHELDSAHTLFRLDASGALLGSRDLNDVWAAKLITRPGGALLTYFKSADEDAPLWVELLDASGATTKPPVQLLASAYAWGSLPGAYVDGAFLLAASDLSAPTASRLKLIRVNLDASVQAVSFAGVGCDALGWDGQKGLLVCRGSYPGPNSTVLYGEFTQRFDASGALLGSPLLLPESDGPTYSGIAPQNDEWLLLNHYPRPAFVDADAGAGTTDGPVGEHVYITRLTASGTQESEPELFDVQPYSRYASLVPLAGDVALAVLGSSDSPTQSAPQARITLERARPR